MEYLVCEMDKQKQDIHFLNANNGFPSLLKLYSENIFLSKF